MSKLKLSNEAAKDNSRYYDVIMGICNSEILKFSIALLFSISLHFAHT